MLVITDLRIDYARIRERERGHVVSRDNPVLCWAARGDHAGARQNAYRLLVGAVDSGWIETDTQWAQVQPGALKPREGTRVALTIRDETGAQSPPYETDLFSAKTDWQADWIAPPDTAPEHAAYFLKRFPSSASPLRARLYAAALGYVEVYINGALVSDARLDPAFTDYSKRVCYTYLPNIESMVREGENEILCVLAPGWRANQAVHIYNKKTEKYSFEGVPQMCLMLEMDYKEGDTRVCSDESWEVCEGPIKQASIFNGEQYDAHSSPLRAVSPAVRVPAPDGKLEPMCIPPIREHALRAPIAVWPDGADAVIADFGQNIAGVLRVPLKHGLRAGQTIVLTHAEELTEDGKLFTDTLRTAQAKDTYICAGDARDVDVWQPRFTYHGFRYARIEGLGAQYDAKDVRAVELRTDVDARSSFRCGNALVSHIHDICVATERANIHSILTDCPQRDERLGWMNDATVRFEETPYNFDIGALFPKVIHDIMDVQNEQGAIGCTAPFVWGAIPADPVCSSFLVAGKEALMHTGNMEIIKEAYPAYKRWEEYLLSRSDDWIVNYTYYGDWAGPADCCVPASADGSPGAQSSVTPGVFMSTGYSYYNCKLLADFARRLNLIADANTHEQNAENIRRAMLRKWYDPATGAFATGSQACQAFALWLGIAPDAEKAARRLHEAVVAAAYRLTTGNLASRYIMDALSDNGYLEDAWRLLTREEYPSIGFMIEQEATTVWERFELMKHPGMNSHNHPMYAAVDYWMYAHLMGLRPVKPGWQEFEVRPRMPDALMSAQATVDTPMGEIHARWTKRYGGAHLQLYVPFGAVAHIVFCGREETAKSGFFTMSVQVQ